MVDEEHKKETQGEGEKKADEDSKNRIPAGEEGPDRLEEAKKVVSEMKAENDRREKLLKEEKDFEADRMVSGRGRAAQKAKELWETDNIEFAKRVEKGEIDPFSDKR